MRSRSLCLAAAAFAALVGALPLQASAQTVQRAYASNPGGPDSFNSNELVESGHQFFGSASRGLALALQEAIRRWGEPNGYILGQEASGAFFGGKRQGAIMKSLGWVGGLPDLILIHEGRVYGLEIKAPGRRPTETQLETLAAMEAAGAFTAVAEGLDRAVATLSMWGLLRGRAQ